MQSTLSALSQRVTEAIAEAFQLKPEDVNPRLTRSQDDKFGDYQCNAAMGLAKQLGQKPRDIAQKIVDQLKTDDLCEAPEIAGPGFINLKLTTEYLAGQLTQTPPNPDDAAASEQTGPVRNQTGPVRDRIGIPTVEHAETIVVDMSSPNLAKEMHVGHLRSTVIGDSIARILEFAGHNVHRVNHVGDWGTQFGMLLEFVRQTQPDALEQKGNLVINDLEKFYVQAKKRFDDDPEFADRSRKNVVQLQSHDPNTIAIWEMFCHESLRHCHAIYEILGVENLVDRGESFYGPMLGDVVEEFKTKGHATESDGALCVFLDGFTSRDGDPLPMMIQKSDGGYNYDTTDLAAIRHRIHEMHADRIIYVVGIPQKQHFQMLFAAAEKVGWSSDNNMLTHIGFGSVLGEDGRPFKTREGGSVKLKDLLDEAEARARRVVEQNVEKGGDRSHFDESTINHIARTVAIGAVKYFDLSHNLASDYKFNFDNMLAMEGNTAPYMLYAYARIRSIARKADTANTEENAATSTNAPIVLEHDSELRLARMILRFPEIIDTLLVDLRPNLLTDYLFDLSKAFNMFYDRKQGVRVIDAKPMNIRASRLRLCDITARVLKTGLNLLGINTIERM